MPYSVTITGPSSVSGEITMSSAGAEQLAYNTVASGSILPVTMNVFVDGVQRAGVTLPAKYVGQAFGFTPVGGSQLEGVFASGNVNLTTPTTAAPTTTSGPTTAAPGGDGYSSTVNVHHIVGTANNNNGGVVKKGGTIADDNFTSSPVVNANERQVFGSVVVNNSWADPALSGGVFANKTQRPIGARMTTQIAGVSSNVLLNSPARPGLVRSINKLETLRTRRFTTAIRENKYNRFTGQFASGYPVVAVDSLANDVAANPTRSAPGRIVFKLGGKVPVASNYKAKTN